MRIVVHRGIPDDPQLQSQWNKLAEQGDPPEVFYTHQWALAMHRAYGDLLLPFLVLLYDGERLAGVASLATDVRNTKASFLAGTTADYCDFLSAPAHRQELIGATLGELVRQGIGRIELANLPANSASVVALRSTSKAHDFHIFLRPAYLCAQVELGDGESRTNLKNTVLRKNSFRRSIARLEKEGPVALRNLRSWPEIERGLPEFFTAHIARFLATGRISNLAQTERRAFLTELARLLSTQGWMNVSQLTLGAAAIAWNYGFQFGGSWFWYQPTFETAHELLSPGYCLLGKMIVQACDDPEIERVDLGLGAEEYKERFANRTRATLHGTITRSRAEHVKATARYALASNLSRWPQAGEFVRRSRARVVSVREQTPDVLALAGKTFRRVWSQVWSREEVVFYRWPESRNAGAHAASNDFRLAPLDLNLLAQGAMRFSEDAATCTYLLRSANRFHSAVAQGFALVDPEGVPMHFCWVGPFDGFFMRELDTQLKSEVANADLIFDCWTPHAVRGKGHYSMAIAGLAHRLLSDGREPWIFSAASNHASVRGIQQAGFERQYSRVRRKTLGLQRVDLIGGGVPRSAGLPASP